MAQWLGCRSRGWQTAPNLLLTGGHFVGKLSAVGQPVRPTQPSIPPGLVIVVHVFSWITETETFNNGRLTGATRGSVAAQVKVRLWAWLGLLWPRLNAGPVLR